MRQKLHCINLIVFLIFSFGVSIASSENINLWRKEKSCGTRLKTEKIGINGCVSAYCAQITTEYRVCACILKEDSDDTKIYIERKGKIIREWKGSMYPPAGGAAFRIDKANISGAGKDDLLVATMASESQGIGIQYWEVRAVVDDRVTNAVPVDDYGILGFATRSSLKTPCHLLATQWLWGWEPKKGDGLYLYGRWFDFSPTSTELYSALDRPAIYRRYLYSFERMRLSALEKEEPMPLLWFTDTATAPLIGPYPKHELSSGQQLNQGDGG
jgi:hypothetical protein